MNALKKKKITLILILSSLKRAARTTWVGGIGPSTSEAVVG